MAKQSSVKYWPAVAIITGSLVSGAAFYELTISVPCWFDVAVHSAGILAGVLRQFCPVPGFEVPLSTCLCGSLKVFEVLLQIGEAVGPLVCAAIL